MTRIGFTKQGITGKFLLTRPSRDVTEEGSVQYYALSISTHTPLAGRDNLNLSVQEHDFTFLLTRPSRDVTRTRSVISPIGIFLLTRPSRDVTHSCIIVSVTESISTHTPLAGRDGTFLLTPSILIRFLLTRPSRDVTDLYVPSDEDISISTHTPLAGRDILPATVF